MRLQGVNIASLEWTSTGENVLQSLAVAISDWDVNIIRLPLAQDRWFGRAKEQNDGGTAYRKLVQEVVQAAAARQCYVLMDLHWSDAGDVGPEHRPALDARRQQRGLLGSGGLRLCQSPGGAFRSVQRTARRLLGSLVQRRHGQPKKATKRPGAKASNTTRRACRSCSTYAAARGRQNVIVAGGLDWAYDLSGLMKGYALADPKGNGVVYATHIYPWKKDWDRHVTVVLDKYPVLVGEVGCQPGGKEEDPKTWAPKVLDYIGKAPTPLDGLGPAPEGRAVPDRDWNYTPTPYWGVLVKKALRPPAGK